MEPDVQFLEVDPLYFTKGGFIYSSGAITAFHFTPKDKSELESDNFSLVETKGWGFIEQIDEFDANKMDFLLLYHDLSDCGYESIITLIFTSELKLFAFGKKFMYPWRQSLFLGKIISIINNRPIYLYPYKDQYVFETKNNLVKTFATVNRPNGSKYIGEIKNHKIEGKGKKIGKEGYIFEGEWKNNIQEGKGKVICPDGKIFEGNFINNFFDGEGKFTYVNGTQYEAIWDKEKKVLKGTIIFPNGEKYVGEFKDSFFHGQGIFFYPNGDKYYEGEYVMDKMEGKGRLTRSDGFCYEGEWKNNMKHGHGKYTLIDGTQGEGLFVNDLFADEGIYKDGDLKYEAKWDKEKKHLVGSLTIENNTEYKYKGEFKNGLEHGFGVYSRFSESSGTYQKYIGEIKNGYITGFGTHFPSGNDEFYVEGELEDEEYKYVTIIDKQKKLKYEGHFEWNTIITFGIGTLTIYKENTILPTKNDESSNILCQINGQFGYNGECEYGYTTFENGDEYESEFIGYNIMDGVGKYFSKKDGSIYMGEFRDNKFEGYGTLTYPDGRKKSGLFKNNVFVGDEEEK